MFINLPNTAWCGPRKSTPALRSGASVGAGGWDSAAFSPVPPDPEGHLDDGRHCAGNHFSGFEFFLLTGKIHARPTAAAEPNY